MQLTIVQQNAIAITAAVFTGIFLLLCCCRQNNKNSRVSNTSPPRHDKVLNLLN